MPSSSSEVQVKVRVDADMIQRAVLRVRGQNVMLDSELASLYQVGVKVLNQAVKRNHRRFPPDFMFQLTAGEFTSLRSQIVTASPGVDHQSLRSQAVTLDGGRGRHRKYRPNAFTEQGVAMLSSVLRSQRAIRVNIEIMRACAAPLCSCAACSAPTKNWPENSTPSNRSTMANSARCFRPSGN